MSTAGWPGRAVSSGCPARASTPLPGSLPARYSPDTQMCRSAVSPSTPRSSRTWCRAQRASPLATASGPSWLCQRTCAASIPTGVPPSAPSNPHIALVQARVLREKEDIFYLTFQELHDVVRANHVDDQLICRRKDAFRSYQALTPPRVLTSD